MDNQNNNPNNRNQNNRNNNRNNKQGLPFIILVTLVTMVMVMALFQFQGAGSDNEISYNEFLKKVDDGKVEEVVIQSSRIVITEKKEKGQKIAKEYYTGVVRDDSLAERLEKADVKFSQQIPDTTSAIIAQTLFTLLPVFLLIGVFVWMTRKMSKGGGMMGIGKSNAKMYVEKQTGVTFKDVAGQDEAKESLQEVVDFLHNPGKYTSVGAKLPKGALLVGPPGTGKTLLAKAVAGEANVPFFSLSGSAFVEMYVGVGASRVRDLFKQAQQMAPCIIFIDEIDAIGKSRDNQLGSNDEREQTLNQLLAEMDGFESNKGLVLLAATNRPEILDPALLRPGRFDRRIVVEKPDLKGRVDVLKVHSKDVRMDETVDLEAIALATSGAVGSDLANMINEAAINAVKNGVGSFRGGGSGTGRQGEEGPYHEPGGEEDRILPRGRPCSGKRIAEGFGAGSEDHDRAQNHGGAWVCYADAGRREVPEYQEGATCDAGGNAGRPGGGRDRVRYGHNGCF